MTRKLSIAAYILAAVVTLWMSAVFAGSNTLALLITLIIGLVFAVGCYELHRYQGQTENLLYALHNTTEPVADLNLWIQHIDVRLQHSVRLRIEGEKIGLPSPTMSPYLVGLLVMLGLLGTFAGMVDTLKGAVIALEGSTELQAIRAGLAAPIQGLSMAFGTSVVGITTSAILGFISTLSKRDRMQAARLLDAAVSRVFQKHSFNFHRQRSYQAMQEQAEALPLITSSLGQVVEQLANLGEKLGSQLLSNQEQFNQSTENAYRELASSVELSIKQSLSDTSKQASDSVQPVVKAVMDELRNEALQVQQELSAATEKQVNGLTEHLALTSSAVSKAWSEGINAHAQTNNDLIERLESSNQNFLKTVDNSNQDILKTVTSSTQNLLQSVDNSGQESLQQQQAADQLRLQQQLEADQQRLEQQKEADELRLQRLDQSFSTLSSELNSLKDDEAKRAGAATDRLETLQSVVAEQLAQLGQRLEDPMTRLIETASETPKAAAEVIGKLRSEISNNMERDNQLLEERRNTMTELNALASSLEQSSTSQSQAIASMTEKSAAVLVEIGEQFSQHMDAKVSTISEVIDQFSGSSAEMASLGDAFSQAVELFNTANEQLIGKLGTIEQSISGASERSDEQLAYYVAQAREIIDHSTASQQDLIQQIGELSKHVSQNAEHSASGDQHLQQELV